MRLLTSNKNTLKTLMSSDTLSKSLSLIIAKLRGCFERHRLQESWSQTAQDRNINRIFCRKYWSDGQILGYVCVTFRARANLQQTWVKNLMSYVACRGEDLSSCFWAMFGGTGFWLVPTDIPMISDNRSFLNPKILQII